MLNTPGLGGQVDNWVSQTARTMPQFQPQPIAPNQAGSVPMSNMPNPAVIPPPQNTGMVPPTVAPQAFRTQVMPQFQPQPAQRPQWPGARPITPPIRQGY